MSFVITVLVVILSVLKFLKKVHLAATAEANPAIPITTDFVDKKKTTTFFSTM